MMTILYNEILCERPNAAAVGAYSIAIGNGATKAEASRAAKNAVSEGVSGFMNRFKGIAKKTTTTQEFIREVQKINNVPANVSDYFFRIYGENGQLDMFKAADKFYKKYH